MTAQEPAAAGLSRRELVAAFSGIMLATLLAALDYTIVATALPKIIADLEGFENLSWVVTSYLIASTVTIPLYGKLSDLYGRRRLFIVAIGLFLVGSALCGFAQDIEQLIAFRALQGLGAGGLIPLSQTAIGDLVSPRERGRYQGFISAVWALAAIAGPLVGGTLTDVVSWRWIFLINVPLGLLALVVILRTMRLPDRLREHSLDIVGAVLVTTAITLLLLASGWGGSGSGWGSPRVVGGFVAGVLLLAAFVAVERRAAEPLLPLDLFRLAVFSVSSGAAFAIGGLLLAVTIFVPVYVQGVLGGSATSAGLVLLPLSGGWVVMSVIAGQLVSRTGRYKIFPIIGSALVTLGAVLLVRVDADTPQPVMAAYLVVFGMGMGVQFQSYVVATQSAVPVSQLGVSTSALQLFRSLGGTLVVAGLGALLTARVGVELPGVDANRLLEGGATAVQLDAGAREGLAAALRSVFAAVVPIALLAGLCAWLLPERPLRG